MKVLAAVDFGDSSLEALRQARALAHHLGASLAACHVLPAVYDPTAAFPGRDLTMPIDSSSDDASARKALVEHARSQLGLELTEVFIEHGPAYAGVVRCAERFRADFVVIGSHDRSGLARAFLGSVAERVVRQAHCSVLVARSFAGSGVVLAATDLSEPSLAAIREAAAAAKRSAARLVAVSVLDQPSAASSPFFGLMGALPAVPPVELQQEMRDATRSTLERVLEQAGAVGEARVLEGSAASEIAACAEALGADLVVVGTRGRTGLARLALGSVAETVIRNVSCSALAVRLGGEVQH
jgi:nucleotide-binding universal stress UspA family protein